MAYSINLTDGSLLASVADGTINADASSLVLVGKNFAGYGEYLNENLIHLLESGANTTEPTTPLTGQLWYDATDGVLKVYSGSEFKNLGAAATDATEPTSGMVEGDLWWDPASSQLNVYDGSDWVLIGPIYTSGTGTSGAIPDIITDDTDTEHVVVMIYIADEIVAIISNDAAFTPGSSIDGFGGTIDPGINLASGTTLEGTASNAEALNSLSSTQFLRSDENDITTGTLAINNDSGLSVGVDNDYRVVVSGSDVTLKNTTSNGDLILGVNMAGTPTNVITVDGATGLAWVNAVPTATLGIANKGYVDDAVETIDGGTAFETTISTIQLKRSSTESEVPLTTELELGELAVNTYDGKVFIKKTGGGTSVIEVGNNLSVSTTGISVTIEANDFVFVTADSLTITLPASPTAGDRCYIGVSDASDCDIAGNGEDIMGSSDNMEINVTDIVVGLIYVTGYGWRIL